MLDKTVLRQSFPKVFLILLGYIASYVQWSLVLLVLAVASLVWLESKDKSNSKVIKGKAEACGLTKKDLLTKVDEIPLWVKFPDRERAEWLNQIIEQFWPTLNNYVVKLFRTSIQNKIRKKQPRFRFENIDFGCTPPKIDGIKVYNRSMTKDSIIVDFDVFYDGNCEMDFSMSGAQMGGIRDFQLSVEVRVVLKPLLLKLPLIGGVQIFFLNTPDISFDLEGLSGIPGLSYLIRTKIEEKLTKLIVFPNKFTKRFTETVEPVELKALEPEGVLRVHVVEAQNLMGLDFTGKSDPYAVLKLGAQKHETEIINQTLNPKWDHWCEFVVADPLAQHLSFKLFDHDKVNEDDFLGGGEIDLGAVIKGNTDEWIKLNDAKHGEIHLRFTWLSLSADYTTIHLAREEAKLLKVRNLSTALLTVYVESAQHLPMLKPSQKPHCLFTLKLGQQHQKSKVKKHTVDPSWEQGFVFLVPDPEQDTLYLTVADRQTNGRLCQELAYKISDLTKEENLRISKKEFELAGTNGNNSKITMSLQLRVLTNQLFEPGEDDDDSDSDSEDDRKVSPTLSTSSSKSGSVRSLLSLTKFAKNRQEVTEENLSVTKVGDLSRSPLALKRTSSARSSGESGLGKIEIETEYSEPRQRFIVTVHRVCALPLKDSKDIPDPYVKVKLSANDHTVHSVTAKTKTDVKVDTRDPVYRETFEYLLCKSDVFEHALTFTVKSKKRFYSSVIGEVTLNLKYISLEEPQKMWYDLCPKND